MRRPRPVERGRRVSGGAAVGGGATRGAVAGVVEGDEVGARVFEEFARGGEGGWVVESKTCAKKTIHTRNPLLYPPPHP